MATEKALNDAANGLAYGKDARELYQGAMLCLIRKAYEERAKFPLNVAVTNGEGEAWNAVVTIKGGEIDCKHRPGGGTLTFPMRMVASEAHNDIVASMDLALVNPSSLADASRN
jgi:hypothetical protein